jgi:transposase
MPAQVVFDEEYQLRWERVAAVDVAKASGMVCVRLPAEPGQARRSSRVWEVPAEVAAVAGLAGELAAAGVQIVTLESTSDYWKIWHVVLAEAGLRVRLVNSRQTRNLPGRPKTDKADAQWLARLTEMGLLRFCFVPGPAVAELREYTRLRLHLVQDRTRSWQRLEKLLERALCKLSVVASTLASESCREMIRAMIEGERDPRVLAGMAQRRMRGKLAELERAFAGMRFTAAHAVAARAILTAIDGLDEQIAVLEGQIAVHLDQIPAAQGVNGDGTTGPGAGTGPDAVVLPAVQRLAEIPGMSEGIAAALIAEIGLDMTAFPTAAALCGWAGMAPVADQSGPRTGRGKKGKGNTYVRGLLALAGNGAAPTATFLGERHRRISARPGGGGRKKANMAVGRSILVIAWHLLADRTARFTDLGPDHYARHTDTSRKTRGHIRQLQALGYDVTLTSRETA